MSRVISGCNGVLWGGGIMSKMSGFDVVSMGPLGVDPVSLFIVSFRRVLLLCL